MGEFRAARGRYRAGLGLVASAAIAIIAGTAGPAGASEGTIRNAGTAEAIQDSYIVVFKDGTTQVQATASDLSTRYGGSVRHVYQTAVKGYAATMNEQQAKRVAADPRVGYVEQDQRVYALDTQLNPPSWGLDRIDQRDLPLDSKYDYDTTASNVTAYIVDTGILTSHTTFGGRAVHGRDTVDNDNDATDCQGHGTHVAGTVGGSEYGVAKAVKLVAVRVLNCQGSGSTAGVIAGIDWVTADHDPGELAVANMSLGGGASATLDQAVRGSIADGVTYAVAAGNGDIFGNPQDACTVSPARTLEAITVGATQTNDAKASFSNYGTCVDIFAPGVGITSSWIGSNTATNTISGTSMATPHVAGAAALYLAKNPTATPQQVRDGLVNAATSGKVTNPGPGSPNKLLFTGSGTTPPPGCGTKTNANDVQVPDAGAAVTSPISVSGCEGNAPADLKVEVHIKHTYRGDLVIDLIAPDGSSYRLKNSSGLDSADNVDATYTVNASSETKNGTWQLKVQDVYRFDTGFIDSWSLFL